MAKMQSSETCL